VIENKVGAKGTGRSIEETERSKKRGTERLGVDAVENSQAIPSTIYKSFYIICLSSIILSPLNGNVKMSPRETGDIHVESERVTTSDRPFYLFAWGVGMCQSRRTPLLERATGEAIEAEVIAVSGDPLKSIGELEHVKFVMHNGSVFKNELTK